MRKTDKKIEEWRLRYKDGHLNGYGFEELVVGDLFHLERMDTRHFWIGLGEKHIHVFLDKKGRVERVTVTDEAEL